MGVYIKKFDSIGQYMSYINSSAFTAPNTSLCLNDNSVHYNPHNYENDYVDLGLPSGTLWATKNIGASYPKDVGLYFAWGEIDGVNSLDYYGIDNGGGIRGLRSYDINTYKFYDENNVEITKYNFSDGLEFIEYEDDAAYNLCGRNEWKIPCHGQYSELLDFTTYEYDDELRDYVFVSNNNGKKLYIPNSGLIINTTLTGGEDEIIKCFALNTCSYFIDSEDEYSCVYACCHLDDIKASGDLVWEKTFLVPKYYAMPIRPVKIKNKQGQIIGNWYDDQFEFEPKNKKM